MKSAFLAIAFAITSFVNSKYQFEIKMISREEATELNGGNPLKVPRKFDIPLHSGLLPDDWLYYGTFYVGSTPDKVNLLMTSLTDWTAIAAFNC
jgi:hypothetical protein